MKLKFQILFITMLFLSCKVDDAYDSEIIGSGNIVEANIGLKNCKRIDIRPSAKFSSSINKAKIKIIKSDLMQVKIKTDENVLKHLCIVNDIRSFYMYSTPDVYYINFSKLTFEFYVPEIEDITFLFGDSILEVIGFDEIGKLTLNSNGSNNTQTNIILPERFSIGTFDIDFIENITISNVKNLNIDNYNQPYLFVSLPDTIKLSSSKLNINIHEALEELEIETDEGNLESDNPNLKISKVTASNSLSISSISIDDIEAKSLTIDYSYSNFKDIGVKINNLDTPHLVLTNPKDIEIKNSNYSRLDISGYILKDFKLNYIGKLDELNINIGSGELSLSGEVTNLNVNLDNSIYGSTDLITIFDGTNLLSKNCSINLDDRSKAVINAESEIKYTVTGYSELNYKGIKVPNTLSKVDEYSTVNYLGEIQ